MQIKKSFLVLVGLLFSLWGFGQDLLTRIPAEADLVVNFNNPAIFKRSTFEDVNELMQRLGVFSSISENGEDIIHDIRDIGMDYSRNAYVYKTSRDSLHYIGVLLPLHKNHEIQQKIMRKWEDQPSLQGFQRKASADQKMLGAWNDNMLFLLLGEVNSFYFKDKTVAERYGLEIEDYVDAAYAYDDYDTYDSADTVTDVAIETDTLWATPPPVADVAEEYYNDVLRDSIDTYWQGYDFGSDSLALDTDDYTFDWDNPYDNAYTDSIYQAEQERLARNNSIQDSLFTIWLARDFESFLFPSKNFAHNKQIKPKDKQNTLARVWIKDLDEVYKGLLPLDAFTRSYGLALNNFNYGYQDATFDLVQDAHTLKITSSIGLDKDMEKALKGMYNSKYNPKFARYVPADHLGYMTINVNTEALIKQLPTFISRWYSAFLYEYADIMSIMATSIDIAFDEKAIANVMTGDHVLFVNNVQKVTREYTDYEYDDNFDYQIVTKTKEEHVPNFLWMFTSNDQRLFKQVFAYGERRGECTQDDGIYTFSPDRNTDSMHVYFKDNIVFIGNNFEQIQSIRDNRFEVSNDSKLKKELFSNTASLVVHTNRIPQVLQSLEVPIMSSWNRTVKNLSKYGDMQAKVQGIRKKRILSELSLDFPKEEDNALGYLLKQIGEQASNNE